MIDLSSPYVLNYFPEDSVSLYTTSNTLYPRYKIIIRLKDEEFIRVCNLSAQSPEELLYRFMHELINFSDDYHIKYSRIVRDQELVGKLYISKMYRTSIKDLKERLLMQRTLNQPLIEVFEEVKI
jgi:hypothetical protein